MRIQELRQKSKPEIETLLREDREKLRQMRFDLASGKIKNISEIRKIKKDVARIMTILK